MKREEALVFRKPEVAFAVAQVSVSWPSIFAGAFVALLVYAIFLGLGMAIGGAQLENLLQGDGTLSGLGAGAGLWQALAVSVALFAGAYVAGRSAGAMPVRSGRIQGLVVAGLFFTFLLSQFGPAVGGVGNGLSASAETVGGAVGEMAQMSESHVILDEAFSDLTLREPAEVVVAGVAARLMQGEEEAALTYLSRQAGITRAEAQERIDSVRAQFQRAVLQAGTSAADAMQVMGWTLFGSMVLGSFFAMLGGGLGLQMTLREGIDRVHERAIEESKVA